MLSFWDGACSRRTVAVYQEEGGGEREENIELFTILIHGREKFPCLWALWGGGGGEKGYTEMGGGCGGGILDCCQTNSLDQPAKYIFLQSVGPAAHVAN